MRCCGFVARMQHTYSQSLILRASTVSKTSISLSSRDNQDHSLLGGLFLLYIKSISKFTDANKCMITNLMNLDLIEIPQVR